MDDEKRQPAPQPDSPPPRRTRREALLAAGKRAAYAAPLVISLSLATRRAAASDGTGASCVPSGDPCTTHEECCSNLCDIGVTNNCLPN